MLFSVIIPTHNGLRFLERAVTSVLKQSYDDFEVIIVDDGSTDATPELIENLVGQASGTIHSLHQKNSGPGAARNRGVGVSSGRYLLFLDDDDELLPDALALFAKEIERDNQVDFLWAGHYSHDEQGKIKKHGRQPFSVNNLDNFLGYIRGRFGLSQGEGVLKREIFARLHYPESIRNNEDVVFFAQILALYRCRALAEYVVTIHKRKESCRHNIESIKATSDRVSALLFDPEILPAIYMPFKDEFLSSRYLSLFRALYYSGRFREARDAYAHAIRIHRGHLTQWSYLRKYVRAWLAF
ncbi:MAG: glycosyltransferase family 2 protein [Proteobacteria bacterium]|nr:glycosyltransferase family 2 protein [Pseudomonadota bacterium]MBU1641557.1 glycosyltransferase family 2 protein [Pseudomonadota bacterium]